jgi:integrase
MAARYREPYSIYPRRMPSGLTVWYYYTYSVTGKRTNGVTTGIGFQRERDRAKSRREAESYCLELYKRGRLGAKTTATTLAGWIERHHFWEWRYSSYVRGILARSEKGKPGITEGYVNDVRKITERRIIPYHGHIYLDEITPAHCEELLFTWSREVSHKTCNNYRSVYSSMLGEAARLGDIPRNPWDSVQQLAASTSAYGGITIAEGSRIIARDGVDLADHRHLVYHLATRTAFLAGLRVGEVCGLFTDDVRTRSIQRGNETITMHYLDVSMQYNSKVHRRVAVKDKDTRAVPITPELFTELEQLIAGQGRYLFSLHPKQAVPLSQQRIREWLYRRMDTVGIAEDQRISRNLTFHSARRFFNTLLRRSVSGDVLRKMTGHDSDEMTEHYTDYLPEDLQAISAAQTRVTEIAKNSVESP